jgi:hypothetical protein
MNKVAKAAPLDAVTELRFKLDKSGGPATGHPTDF